MYGMIHPQETSSTKRSASPATAKSYGRSTMVMLENGFRKPVITQPNRIPGLSYFANYARMGYYVSTMNRTRSGSNRFSISIRSWKTIRSQNVADLGAKWQ